MSSYRNPDIFFILCLPFRHLFREPFAMQGFSLATSMHLKFHFASFRGKYVIKIHRFPQRNTY